MVGLSDIRVGQLRSCRNDGAKYVVLGVTKMFVRCLFIPRHGSCEWILMRYPEFVCDDPLLAEGRSG